MYISKDTLEEVLCWAEIALWDSPNIGRDNEILEHKEIIENLLKNYSDDKL